MKAQDAAKLIDFLEQHGLEVYVDGGWAVDALLGEQTRRHADLDVVLPQKFVPRLRELLDACGYQQQQRQDSWECNFVLVDTEGRELDVHSYTWDAAGNHVHGVAYRAEQLTGPGYIDGRPVRCISAEWLVKFHTGYELDENDFRDVSALCARFHISLPDEYAQFTK
jgi:lincosamide nucleotidyltransferase A/C/D/E